MYVRIFWKDETRNPDKTYSFVDNGNGTMTFERAGTQIQAGTNMSAPNFNSMEEGILSAHAALDALMQYVMAKIGHSDRTLESLEDYLKVSFFATSDTAEGTTAKVATSANGDFVLAAGAKVAVKFTNANTVDSPTLNVDGKGAKSIRSVGTTAAMAYRWRAGEVIEFVYDGTNYVMVEGGVADTTYYGATKLLTSVDSTSEVLAATPKSVLQAYMKLNYGTCPTAAATAAKTVAISNFVLSAGVMVAVKFSSANTAGAPTLNVNSTGAKAIFYNGAAAASSAIYDSGKVYLFIYDGTNWVLLNGADAVERDILHLKATLDAVLQNHETIVRALEERISTLETQVAALGS
ncbi:MAG: tail fiber protein [Alphaproteobacteria bacterium]|nr:tail fiber protein [Alphaproteobacteria bacterium]